MLCQSLPFMPGHGWGSMVQSWESILPRLVMITNIEATDYRIIREASCAAVPRAMFICGPNGVGKTALFDAIGRRVGITDDRATTIAVAPATRTWRKKFLQSR